MRTTAAASVVVVVVFWSPSSILLQFGSVVAAAAADEGRQQRILPSYGAYDGRGGDGPQQQQQAARGSRFRFFPEEGLTYNDTDSAGVYNVSAQPYADRTPRQLHINPWIPPAADGGWRSLDHAATMFSWTTDINYDCPPTVEIKRADDDDDGDDDSKATNDNSSSRLVVSNERPSEQYVYHTNTTFLWKSLPTGSFITYASPFQHHVAVQNLLPDTAYRYRVGASCEGPDAWTRNWTTYRTPPAAGKLPTVSGIQTIMLLGDVGQTVYSKNTIDNMLKYVQEEEAKYANNNKRPPQMILNVGDLAYGDGEPGLRWDRFGEMMHPLSSVMNTVTMPGNHEVEIDSLGNDAMVGYVNRYFMPGDYSHPTALHPITYHHAPVPSMVDLAYDYDVQYIGGSSYYVVEQGLVTFIILNTYNGHKHGPGSHMYEWCKQALRAVDRTITPWVIVGMHAPWYNTNSGHTYDPSTPAENEPDTAGMAVHYEPLFNEYKVNVVFSGHVHAYERFHPTGLNATCRPTAAAEDRESAGPTYVTIGDGGNHERLYLPEILTGLDDQLRCSAYRNNEYYGFGLLHVHNASTAEWVWRPNPAGSERVPAAAAAGARIERGGYVDRAFITNYAVPEEEEDEGRGEGEFSDGEEEFKGSTSIETHQDEHQQDSSVHIQRQKKRQDWLQSLASVFVCITALVQLLWCLVKRLRQRDGYEAPPDAISEQSPLMVSGARSIAYKLDSFDTGKIECHDMHADH